MAGRYGRSEVIALYASATAMIRETIGISSPEDPVGVAVAVDSLVVVANDHRNVGVCVNLHRIRSPIAECAASAGVPQASRGPPCSHAGRQPDLSDVMDETGTEGSFLLFGGRPNRRRCRVST